MGSGRAQVDFNHRLAGKSIVYDFEVLRKVETDQEKVRALIDRRLAGEGSKVSFEMANGAVDVTIPEDLFLVEGLQIIKRGISNDVFKFVPTTTELTFAERFKNEKAQPRKEEPRAKKPEGVQAPAAPKPRRKKAEAPAQTA
jgi:peptidylprolyl isomerase